MTWQGRICEPLPTGAAMLNFITRRIMLPDGDGFVARIKSIRCPGRGRSYRGSRDEREACRRIHAAERGAAESVISRRDCNRCRKIGSRVRQVPVRWRQSRNCRYLGNRRGRHLLFSHSRSTVDLLVAGSPEVHPVRSANRPPTRTARRTERTDWEQLQASYDCEWVHCHAMAASVARDGSATGA